MVTLADASQGGTSWSDAPVYIAAQVLGAFIGVAAAHLMFGEALLQFSHHPRAGGGISDAPDENCSEVDTLLEEHIEHVSNRIKGVEIPTKELTKVAEPMRASTDDQRLWNSSVAGKLRKEPNAIVE